MAKLTYNQCVNRWIAREVNAGIGDFTEGSYELAVARGLIRRAYQAGYNHGRKMGRSRLITELKKRETLCGRNEPRR